MHRSVVCACVRVCMYVCVSGRHWTHSTRIFPRVTAGTLVADAAASSLTPDVTSLLRSVGVMENAGRDVIAEIQVT